MQEGQLCSGIVENFMFKTFSIENALITQINFFALISFLLVMAKYQIKLVVKVKFKQHPYTAKAFSSPEDI